ncbi:hypothetical protein [Verminephrobacter aporrectodeae]|uniref:hypothetical protein n=1 Tax=Verminephrobacter aporrectodeae TaxID=1110389 RepID=UPI00023761D6|nr:hypothetical protein [Verminephrobacter aporrectodeae]
MGSLMAFGGIPVATLLTLASGALIGAGIGALFCSYVQKSIFCALMIFPENAFHSPETPRCSPQSAKDEHTLTI